MKPFVLVIDDEPAICDSLTFALEDNYRIMTTTEPEDGMKILEKNEINLILLDLRIGICNGLEILEKIKQHHPNVTVIMMTAYSSIETSIQAIKKGAYHYIEKPINIEELHLLIERALDLQTISQKMEQCQEEPEHRQGFEGFIGKSNAMQGVFTLIERVKDINSNVLIMGESGTGKELVARSIHNAGKRKDGPLEIVNCAAIPETLLESELFGYEKGAFTGATQRKVGKWVAANGGTLFLDEISEMPLSLQAKLLRILQAREITPLGSNKKISLDVRIVSATNKDLKQMVDEGTFREDLFFRLNVIPILIPPLRERKEDLQLLIDFFIDKYCSEMNRSKKSLSETARKLLLDYHYPGNVRELGNIIEYTIALSIRNEIQANDLPDVVQQQNLPNSSTAAKQDGDKLQIPVGSTMKEIEQKVIAATLKYYGGHRQKTAQSLRISERSLRDKIKLYALKGQE